jgi:protein SCO1/2
MARMVSEHGEKIGPRGLAALLAALLLLLPAQGARAHGPQDPQDEILKEIGVDERSSAQVPPALRFTDQDGRAVRLGDYLGAGPVVLTLNYYTCPMLCPLTFASLIRTMGEMKGLSLGADFRILTVSIDPDERPEAAAARSAEVYRMMAGIRNPSSRWAFLRGEKGDIDAIAAAVGFRYKKVGKDFAHPTVAVVLTPQGKVSRYLYGMDIPPRDLRLALLEASEGRIGPSAALNKVIMYCFEYDPVGKKYVLYAANIMKAAGAATLVLVAALLLVLRKREGSQEKPSQTR